MWLNNKEEEHIKRFLFITWVIIMGYEKKNPEDSYFLYSLITSTY